MWERFRTKKWYISIVIILVLAGSVFVYWTLNQNEPEERGILVDNGYCIVVEGGAVNEG